MIPIPNWFLFFSEKKNYFTTSGKFSPIAVLIAFLFICAFYLLDLNQFFINFLESRIFWKPHTFVCILSIFFCLLLVEFDTKNRIIAAFSLVFIFRILSAPEELCYYYNYFPVIFFYYPKAKLALYFYFTPFSSFVLKMDHNFKIFRFISNKRFKDLNEKIVIINSLRLQMWFASLKAFLTNPYLVTATKV